MKICYLANAQSIHTQRWAKHFSAQGNEVTVISFDPAEIEGATVIALPRYRIDRRLNILLNIAKVSRLVANLKPDILHAHYMTSYGFAAALTGRNPYIATAWGTDVLIEPEKSWIYRMIVRYALRKADFVTSMATHMTEHLVHKGYVAVDKIITLPFGVDIGIFNLERRIRRHGIMPPIVVSTRRPDYGMDVDTFVKAAPFVLNAIENVRFIVTGEGPLKKSLKDLADSCGISDHIEFQGEIAHQTMPELLSMTDVFVSTSPSDGNNISLNEAMACGAFPIATDIPANRAWIESGKNGLLYPCKAIDQLARRIIDALKNSEWRQSVMPFNWNLIKMKASWLNSMEEISIHYQRLASENLRNGRKTK